MPLDRSNKKKNNQRSEAAIACAHCSAAVSKRTSLTCVCTQVLFCSQACKELALSPEGSHPWRPGPPEQVVTLSATNPENDQKSQAWYEEHRTTVNEPMRRFMMEEARLHGPSAVDDLILSVDGYARLADQGNTVFAYIAGFRYQNRILGIQTNPGQARWKRGR